MSKFLLSKAEQFFTSVDEYKSHVLKVLKQYKFNNRTCFKSVLSALQRFRRNRYNDEFAVINKNPTGWNGQRLQCHVPYSASILSKTAPHRPKTPKVLEFYQIILSIELKTYCILFRKKKYKKCKFCWKSYKIVAKQAHLQWTPVIEWKRYRVRLAV